MAELKIESVQTFLTQPCHPALVPLLQRGDGLLDAPASSHALGSASATRSVEDRVPAPEHGDEG